MRIIYWIQIITGFATSLLFFGGAIWVAEHLVSEWNVGYDYQRVHIVLLCGLFFGGFYALGMTAEVLNDTKDESLMPKNDVFKNYPFYKKKIL